MIPGAKGLDIRELRLCRGLDENGDYGISPNEVEKVFERNGLALIEAEEVRRAQG